MDATQPTTDPLKGSIERCAAALGDRVRLKQELTGLRDAADARAHFARALFQLELAKSGDPEARSNIPAVADALLVFWRDGSGDALAQLHPALGPLWVGAASLLISFEIKRFEKALHDCWLERSDAVRLKVAMDGLQPDDNQRVEFARCLYHLELARLGIDASRAQFAQRVGLLMEAYRDQALARELVGDDQGLAHLWTEVKPYLEEFFDAQEEQEAAKQEPTRRVNIADITPRDGRTDTTPQHRLEPAPGTEERPAIGAESTSTAPTGQMASASSEEPPPSTTPPAIAPVVARPVPSFRALVHNNPEFVAPTSTAPQHTKPALAAPPPPAAAPPGGLVNASTLFDAELLSASLAPRPPKAPAPLLEEHSAPTPPGGSAAHLGETFAPTPPGGSAQPLGESFTPTPPGGSAQALGDAFAPTPPGGSAALLGDAFAPTPPGGLAQARASEVEVPLGDFSSPTPPGGNAMPLRPPPLGEHVQVTPPGGEVEILEADEAPPPPPRPPPPPPAITPVDGVEAALSIEEDISAEVELDDAPDEATLAFWDYTFASLQLPPVEGQKPRMFTTESRSDKKRLATYVDGLTPHHGVPEAKVLGTIVRLLLAAETKEKSLFGQSNPRRQEALGEAFSLLAGGSPEAAGKVAVWFELDGAETEAGLHRALDLLLPFLGFCARHGLDPTAPEAAKRYLEK